MLLFFIHRPHASSPSAVGHSALRHYTLYNIRYSKSAPDTSPMLPNVSCESPFFTFQKTASQQPLAPFGVHHNILPPAEHKKIRTSQNAKVWFLPDCKDTAFCKEKKKNQKILCFLTLYKGQAEPTSKCNITSIADKSNRVLRFENSLPANYKRCSS